jgi:hypothetical protein
METTTRLSLPYPDSTDNVSGYPAVSADQMVGLDSAVLATHGVLASRPSSPPALNEYYATDTGQLFVNTGSAWLLVSTAKLTYTNLTLASGVSATDAYTPSARIEGDRVFLRGSITPSSTVTTGTTIFTLPAGMAPAGAIYLSAVAAQATTSYPTLLEVQSSGVATLTINWGVASALALNGLNFSLS